MNKKTILIVIITVLTMIGVIGGSYAWYSANVKNDENNKDITVTTGTLGITYEEGNNIEASSILPGWSGTKTLSIKNTGSNEVTYKIVWSKLENSFVGSDLVYTVTSTNEGGSVTETIMPKSGENVELVSNIKIPSNTTQTYTVKIEFKNKEENQNSNMGASINGTIQVYSNEEILSARGTGEEIVREYMKVGLSKIEHDATESQNYATSSYRYTGSSPNNYVMFNNELWRIIGVMEVENASGKREKRIKIIRDESIGNYSYDSSASSINSGYGVNAWQDADIMTLLNNGAYYNRTSGTCYTGANNAITSCDFTTTGLTTEAKNMIEDTKYYLGGSITDNYSLPVKETYNYERGTNLKGCSGGTYCNDTVERLTTWTGKIGLMYPSDYGYAASSECYSLNMTNYSSGCMKKDWLYNNNFQWIINHYVYTKGTNLMFNISNTGYLSSISSYNSRGVRPVTYLKSNIKITNGTGTVSDSYKISL